MPNKYSLNNIVNKLFKVRSTEHYIQFLRYVISGFTAFTIDTLILFFFTDFIHINYLTSTILSFTTGIFVSYFFNSIWVFNNRKLEQQSVELLVFILISLTGLIFTFILMWIFTSILSIYYIYSKLMTTIIIFLWNYILKKSILF